jgi:hypothetical protein
MTTSHHAGGRSHVNKEHQAQEQCQWIVDMYEALAQAVIDTGVRQ